MMEYVLEEDQWGTGEVRDSQIQERKQEDEYEIPNLEIQMTLQRSLADDEEEKDTVLFNSNRNTSTANTEEFTQNN